MRRKNLGVRGIIVDEETLEFVAERETRQAPRLQYPVSLLAILPTVEGGGSSPDPSDLAEQIARVISPVVRNTDLVSLRAASPTLYVLLVGADLEDLGKVIQRIIAEVSSHRFQPKEKSKAVTLSLGGSCFPTTAETSQALLGQAGRLAREACHDGPGRSRYRLPGGLPRRSWCFDEVGTAQQVPS